MYENENPVFDNVDAYLEERLTPPDETLELTLNRQDEAGLPPMAVSPLQGAFLNILAKSVGARRILELGTFAGYSTIWLARALPEGGKVITLELQDVNADLSQRNFDDAGLADRIEIRRGPAEKSLNILINDGVKPFDFIFLDADKIRYPTYLDQILMLSRPGTLIIADNVIRNGRILDDSGKDPSIRGVRTFLDMLKDHPQLDCTALQTMGCKGYDGFAMMYVR
ncbi:O-methyltransferase [Ponticaulis sp.]|uniref:O-methyltransferase n=1 Tax=Ponticaulis sp. TaxID=2020902 RepID=UPI000C3E2AFB|nr:O-methyltransferase [Ponticaulis sp.]MBN03362.1 methyltransferase [Ponticaulis sp.]|tara:strand:- start:335 stop:1009 length:675 start_codon:yes stop_codon:yes gene_type:complete